MKYAEGKVDPFNRGEKKSLGKTIQGAHKMLFIGVSFGSKKGNGDLARDAA